MAEDPTASRIDRLVPCPCCGFYTLTDPQGGHYELCPVCFWEDDPVQSEDPAYAGGANRMCLADAQSNFVRFGACDQAALSWVRAPRIEEVPRPVPLMGLAEDLIPPAERRNRVLLLGIARAVIAGEMEPLDGCSAAAAIGAALLDRRLAPGLLFLASVSGEFDAAPRGAQRALWAPELLARMDAELAEYEERVRVSVVQTFLELVAVLMEELMGTIGGGVVGTDWG